MVHRQKVHDKWFSAKRFTTQGSRQKVHDNRFTTKGSRQKVHDNRFTTKGSLKIRNFNENLSISFVNIAYNSPLSRGLLFMCYNTPLSRSKLKTITSHCPIDVLVYLEFVKKKKME